MAQTSTERSRKWKLANPEAYKQSTRRNNLKYFYGITPEEWEELFRKQQYQCAICNGLEKHGRNWHTDHCHTTGKVRGILCGWCNTGIGKLQESETVMLNAIAYLKEHYAKS